MKKSILLIILLSIILMSFALPILAQDLEIQYPDIGEVQTPTTTKTFLPVYIRYIFVLSLMVAGLIAFGAIVLGGLQYITSAGNPSQLSDAKDRILSGLLGLVILLSSYLILNTINPQLVILKMPGIGIEQGIILYKNSTLCNKWRGSPDPNSKELKNDDFLKLKISHPELRKHFSDGYLPGSFYSFNSEDDLDVKVYSNKNYEPVDYPFFDSDKLGLIIEKNNENGCNDISGGIANSIKLTWKTPGVYLYTDTNSKGTSFVYRASSNLTDEIEDKVSSVMLKHSLKIETEIIITETLEMARIKCGQKKGEIKTDEEGNFICTYTSPILKYGVILHEDKDFKGKVHIVLTDKKDIVTRDAAGQELGKNEASSITVFNPDIDAPDTARITLCRNPSCELENGEEAKFEFTFKNKSITGLLAGISDFINENWSNDGHIKCDKWPPCSEGVSAIYIDSDAPYLVILFDKENYKGNALVVKKSIANLKAYSRDSWGRDWNDNIKSLLIIKTK